MPSALCSTFGEPWAAASWRRLRCLKATDGPRPESSRDEDGHLKLVVYGTRRFSAMGRADERRFGECAGRLAARVEPRLDASGASLPSVYGPGVQWGASRSWVSS